MSTSEIRREICAWWCDGVAVEQKDGWFAIELPFEWPDGDRVTCMVRPSRDGQPGLLTDRGDLKATLFLNGVHDSRVVDVVASSLGFEVSARGVLSREVDRGEAGLAVGGFAQVAATALAALALVNFRPPSMIVPATWANLVTTALHDKRRARVFTDRRKMKRAPIARDIFKHSVVAANDEGTPLLMAPYVSGRQRAWVASLYYLIQKAEPSVRAIVPLVQTRDVASAAREFRDELSGAARDARRILRPVFFTPTDAQYDDAIGDFRGMAKLREGVRTVVDAYDEAARAA